MGGTSEANREVSGPALLLVDTCGFTGSIPDVIDLSLLQTTPLILGRGTPSWKAEIPVNATRDGKDIISRKHAKFEQSEGKLVVTDLNSLNGTYVNSTRIDRHVLQDGDIVQFGGAAKLKCGDRLLASGSSIIYRFVGNKPSRKRKAVAITPPVAPEAAADEQLQGLTKQIDEQHQQIQELLAKLAEATSQCDLLTKELGDAKERQQAPTGEEAEGTRIDFSVLEANLRCALCHGVLIDPVVLPCSHGFCLGCIADRERTLSAGKSLCPTCRPRSKRARKNAKAASTAKYVRSHHLDTILWVWSAAAPEKIRQQQQTREAVQRARYKELGCADDIGNEQDEDSDSETSVLDAEVTLYESVDDAQEDGERCPGCNEFGHSLEDCPHRSTSDDHDDDGDDDDY